MINFKTFMENLWGEIPSTQRKPSDGWTKASQLSMSSNSGGEGGGMPAGMPAGNRMMMDKDEVKSKKKKKDKNDRKN